MKRKELLVVAALVGWAAGSPAAALAAGPTFDCAKAQGEVEKLICADPALSALDHKLDAAYKAATAKAQGPVATELRESQRGWVSGRNDCWKANGQPTWITATWTVDTVKSCVEAQYRLRTAELEALWQLVPPKTVSYACQNNPANEIVVNFFATDPATIRLERGDHAVTLWLVGAAGAGKYEGQNVDLVQQGNTLKVDWLDIHTGKTDELQCRAR